MGGVPHGSLDAQVSAGGDDGYWTNGINIFDAASTFLHLGVSGYNHIFARWTGITIPSRARIAVAYAQVYRDSGNAVDGNRIYFNDVASPAAPTSYSEANGKALTTAYTTWNIPGAGTWIKSPDFSEVIQELIDAHGEYSSGAMMMCLKSFTDTDTVYLRSREYSGNTFGPKLHIEW